MKLFLLLLSRFKYAWRILRDAYLLAIALMAGLIAAGCLLLPYLFPVVGIDLLKIIFILILPLLAIGLCAALFANDFAEGTFHHHISYPYSQQLVFMERLAVCAFLLMIYIAVLLWTVNRWVFPLAPEDFTGLIKHSYSVSLFLGALAALGSLLGRHIAVGLGMGITVWLLEYAMSSLPLNRYYLFQAIWPMSRVADESRTAVALVTVGVILLCGCLLLLGKGRGWLVRRQ